MSMSFTFSRAASLGTAAYAVFALVKPRHLATGLQAPAAQADALDLTAYTYAARDLPVSAIALFSRSPQLITAAMGLRILGDLTDATILGLNATDPKARTKVLSATLGWAVVNTVALIVDRRRAG